VTEKKNSTTRARGFLRPVMSNVTTSCFAALCVPWLRSRISFLLVFWFLGTGLGLFTDQWIMHAVLAGWLKGVSAYFFYPPQGRGLFFEQILAGSLPFHYSREQHFNNIQGGNPLLVEIRFSNRLHDGIVGRPGRTTATSVGRPPASSPHHSRTDAHRYIQDEAAICFSHQISQPSTTLAFGDPTQPNARPGPGSS